MQANDIRDLKRAIYGLHRRSERSDKDKLIDTFVDIGNIFDVLSSNDHQVIFGRRGTGKTHILYYLLHYIYNANDIGIYVDLTNLGSSNSVYSDASLPISERGTRLLVDTLAEIYNGLLDYITGNNNLDLNSLDWRLFDRFADSFTHVKVEGSISTIATSANSISQTNYADAAASTDGLSLRLSREKQRHHTAEYTERRDGAEVHYIHFGEVVSALRELTSALSDKRIWILLDEWSNIPIELQPMLADLFRRTFMTINNVIVKIAAIDHRSNFIITKSRGNYLGLELGADISADVNLDEYLVVDVNYTHAIDFYKNLFYKHILNTDHAKNAGLAFNRPDELISKLFTQHNTFVELVKASEGVPRDAINIAIKAAQVSGNGDNKISIPNVREAARQWYLNDKEATVRSREKAYMLLQWVIDKVIKHRRARAFLLEVGKADQLIDFLFDSRVLHILKRNVSTHDRPGHRYDVYKIDYGCYVDLISTSGNPSAEPLLGIDVPSDDYRAIRRAILDIDEFYSSL